MINRPTAFVIAVAICAGSLLYNKPSDAALGGSDRYWVRIASPDDEMRIRPTVNSRGGACDPKTTERGSNVAPGETTDGHHRRLERHAYGHDHGLEKHPLGSEPRLF